MKLEPFFIIIVNLFLRQLIITVAINDSRRPKRIIGGRKLLDIRREDSGFKALSYMAWIGLTWNCNEDLTIWRRINNVFSFINPVSIPVEGALAFVYNVCAFESPKKLHCGGALITPNVVQTACHCVVAFEQHGTHAWGTFSVQTNWERNMLIYMGQSDVHAFYKPIFSKMLAAHEKCSKMQIRPEYIRYDFGWIILETEVPPPSSLALTWSLTDSAYIKKAWSNLDYAGPYKQVDLEAYLKKVTEQRLVCLTMGFGCTAYNDRSPSRFLRIAWVQVWDYTNCYQVTWKSYGFDLWLPYEESVSWICTQPLRYSRDLGGQHWSGDSGSPITCNNNYVALISSFNQIRDVNLSRHTAIKYAPEANAVEERRIFEGRLLVRYNPGNLGPFEQPDGSDRSPDLRKADLLFRSASHSKMSFTASCVYNTPRSLVWLSLTGIFMHLNQS